MIPLKLLSAATHEQPIKLLLLLLLLLLLVRKSPSVSGSFGADRAVNWALRNLSPNLTMLLRV